MNESIDRTLGEWLLEGPERGPHDGLERALAATRRVHQRPGWTLPERWIPMDLVLAPTRSPRPIFALATMGLLIAALVMTAVYVGALRRTPPAPSFRNGAIVYEQEGDLFIVDQLGGTPRSLVAGPDDDSEPVFSPQGDRIAFVRGESSLMTVRPDGSDVTELGRTGHVGGFDWAPDGAALLVVTFSESDLTVIRSDGSGSHALQVHGRPESASWRPDGRQIVFRRTRGDSAAYIADADGTNARELKIGAVDRLAWSSDGKHLSFLIPCVGQCRPVGIGVADISEDGVVTGLRHLALAARSTPWTDAKWSPDGRQLAFVVRSDSALRVGIAGADGSGLRLVGPEVYEHRAIDLTWAPDGRSLVVFDAVSPGAKALSVDVVTGEQTEVGTPVESWQRLAP